MAEPKTATGRTGARTSIQDCELWGSALHLHDPADLIEEDSFSMVSIPPLCRMFRPLACRLSVRGKVRTNEIDTSMRSLTSRTSVGVLFPSMALGSPSTPVLPVGPA